MEGNKRKRKKKENKEVGRGEERRGVGQSLMS